MGTRYRKVAYRFTKTLRADGTFTAAGAADVTGAFTVASTSALASKVKFSDALTVAFTSPAAITTAGVVVIFGVTAGTIVLAATTTVAPAGILKASVAAGVQGEVVFAGITNALSKGDGTNIAYGDRLTLNASGRLIKSLTAGDFIVARALAACTSDETVISVQVSLSHRV